MSYIKKRKKVVRQFLLYRLMPLLLCFATIHFCSHTSAETVYADEDSHAGETYMGMTVGDAASADDITVDEFINALQNVTDYVSAHGYTYGSSGSKPPCTDGVISCERMVDAALWSLGFTDQPAGGYTLYHHAFGDYLEEKGFIKSYDISDITRGSIVLVRHHNNSDGPGTDYPYGHATVIESFDQETLASVRYDCGCKGWVKQGNQPISFPSWSYLTGNDNIEIFNIPSGSGRSSSHFVSTGDRLVDALIRAFFGGDTDEESIGSFDADENGIPRVPYINQGSGLYDLDTKKLSHAEIPGLAFSGGKGNYIANAGCGQCSTSMALSYIKGKFISPAEFMNNGEYSPGVGSLHTVGTHTAASYGVETRTTNSIDEAYKELKSGNLVMAIEQSGAVPNLPGGCWTTCGHFILLIGVLSDGTIAVNDSASLDRTYWFNGKKGYTKDQVDMHCSSGAGIKYTVFIVPDEMKTSSGYKDGKISDKASAIVAACKTTPTTGMNYCAQWVSNVYMAAGCNRPSGNANDMYFRMPARTREEVKNHTGLKPGMAVAINVCNGGAAAQTYGHVGIYIGNGKIMDSVGVVRTMDLDSWIQQLTPSNIIPRWGYLG